MQLLNTAAESLALSARGYHRVIKVARTIADLDESDSIASHHVAEALRYRPPLVGGRAPPGAEPTKSDVREQVVTCV